MRLLLVGYPGAGKSTQATKLAAYYGAAHISSGALLRDEVAHPTETAQSVADYLKQGDLVPDTVVFKLISARILEAAGKGGYVLDGFPRTLRQAEVTQSWVRDKKGVSLQAVVHLQVSKQQLHTRLRARAEREGHSDDTEATFARRFGVFDLETLPPLAFYSERGLLLDIDGDQPAEDVFIEITNAIESLQRAVEMDGEQR